jgi:hypothetical protein
MSYKRIKKTLPKAPHVSACAAMEKTSFMFLMSCGCDGSLGETWSVTAHPITVLKKTGTGRLGLIRGPWPDLGVSILSQEARSGAKLLLPEFCC